METTLRYKTGDSHPVHNLLAFVGYCEEGHEIWTSVYGDSEAPFRLAKLNGPHLPCGRRKQVHISDKEAPSGQGEAQL
jgi:hypothetical protein